MTTIKMCTDIPQSKKLVKILPIKSADMHYALDLDFMEHESVPTVTEEDNHFELFQSDIPCWSLSALLSVLPTKLQIALAINDFQGDRKEKYVIGSVKHDKYDCFADNPVDACYELILKLHKLNLL